MKTYMPRRQISFNHVLKIPNPEPQRFRSITYSSGTKVRLYALYSRFEIHAAEIKR